MKMTTSKPSQVGLNQGKQKNPDNQDAIDKFLGKSDAEEVEIDWIN